MMIKWCVHVLLSIFKRLLVMEYLYPIRTNAHTGIGKTAVAWAVSNTYFEILFPNINRIFLDIYSNSGPWEKSNPVGILVHVDLYHLATVVRYSSKWYRNAVSFNAHNHLMKMAFIPPILQKPQPKCPQRLSFRARISAQSRLDENARALPPTLWCPKIRSCGSTWGQVLEPLQGAVLPSTVECKFPGANTCLVQLHG